MYETSKRPGWGGQRRFRRMSRLKTTTMTWDGMEFLVFIKARLDGSVCNKLLNFIAPVFLSPFSPPDYIAVDIIVSCSSSSLLFPRLLIQILMLLILLILQAPNMAAAPNPMTQIPWLLKWAEIEPENIWHCIKYMDLSSSTFWVGMPLRGSCTSSTPKKIHLLGY